MPIETRSVVRFVVPGDVGQKPRLGVVMAVGGLHAHVIYGTRQDQEKFPPIFKIAANTRLAKAIGFTSDTWLSRTIVTIPLAQLSEVSPSRKCPEYFFDQIAATFQAFLPKQREPVDISSKPPPLDAVLEQLKSESSTTDGNGPS